MLRFDLPPVYSNVARVQAAVTLIVCLAAIGGYGWLAGLTLIMGLVRGFVSPRKCPSHILIEKALLKLGKAGKKENAGAKMFADKLLFVASTAIVSLWAVDSCFYLVPSYVLAAGLSTYGRFSSLVVPRIKSDRCFSARRILGEAFS